MKLLIEIKGGNLQRVVVCTENDYDRASLAQVPLMVTIVDWDNPSIEEELPHDIVDMKQYAAMNIEFIKEIKKQKGV